MARTAQTAGLDRKRVNHVRQFTDHTGQSATRVRQSLPDVPIPTDFRAQPLFAFQIYVVIPLDLDGPSISEFDGARESVRNKLVRYVGSMVANDAQLPDPIWEIYHRQEGVLDCMEHQRREIAHRKGRKDVPSVLQIPKVSGLCDDSTTGFIIVIDSRSLEAGIKISIRMDGPLWVYFDRRAPSCILERSSERIDIAVERIQRAGDEMRSNLAIIYRDSCLRSDDSPSSSEQDVGHDEDEGTFDVELVTHAGDSVTMLYRYAARLPLDKVHISRPSATEITLSNIDTTSGLQPDLRYVIYIPFLHESGMEDKLELTARAFTSELSSRFSEQKTFFFEFCQPPFRTFSSILAVQKDKNQPEGYTGALTSFSDGSNGKTSTRVRAYPVAFPTDTQLNDAAKVDFEPYRSSIVILDRLDFDQGWGSVLFLLADGGKAKPNEGEQDSSMKPESDDYLEMQLWRYTRMDEVAKRLQMI